MFQYRLLWFLLFALEYSKDLILPTKVTQGSVKLNENSTEKHLADALRKSEISSSKKEAASGKHAAHESAQISLQEDFMCTPDDLYRVFVTEEVCPFLYSIFYS